MAKKSKTAKTSAPDESKVDVPRQKRVTGSHHTAQIGVHAIATKVLEELGWLFREQGADFGIDAQIEVIANGKPTGKLIAVQIKSGQSYFVDKDADGFVFRGDLEHLKYWLDHKLPVIVVLYDHDSKIAYWQTVTSENVTQMSKGWKMSIPRGQKLERAQASRLEEIASTETKEQLQQLKEELREFKCPFCRAPLAQRGGDWVGPEHYGLHEIFECGYHALDGCTKRPCPSDPKFPRFEDYELQFHRAAASAVESKNSWLCVAIPKTDMARRLSLGSCYGGNKGEAERLLRETYERYATKRKSWD